MASNPDTPSIVRVAVGLLTDDAGRVLIAQRPQTAPQGGCWEFPGGKIERGETVEDALRRELAEELGIRVFPGEALIRIPFAYSDRRVLLDVRRIRRFEGEPQGMEGQSLRWVAPQRLGDYRFPTANRAIVSAAMLPDFYAISPDVGPGGEVGWLGGLDRALDRGVRLFQFRVPTLAAKERRRLAAQTLRRVRASGGRLLINADAELAAVVGADGVHLPQRRLGCDVDAFIGEGLLVAASCHDPDSLRRAAQLGVDFAVLSPVRATATHPQAPPLGWRRFRDWVEELPLPVYGLGGLGPEDLAEALSARAQGVAGIRGFWR